MYSKIYSAGISGIDGFIVTVECSARNKIPAFDLVGLPDLAVKEANYLIVVLRILYRYLLYHKSYHWKIILYSMFPYIFNSLLNGILDQSNSV